MNSPQISISKQSVEVTMPDGRHGVMALSQWPRLRDASLKQLENYYTSDEGIHWPDIDEDITFDCVLRGGEERSGLYETFMAIPWVNVSAVARRIGISQSLMAQYIGGTKKPSQARLKEIEACLHALGAELCAINLH